MTTQDKLLRDIETLRETLQLIHIEMTQQFSSKERRKLTTYVEILQKDLLTLLQQLWALEDDKEPA